MIDGRKEHGHQIDLTDGLEIPKSFSRHKKAFRPTSLVLKKYKYDYEISSDSLCGLVVRVLGYRSGGPGSIPGTTKKK
jgi:hypothetical protein